MIAIVVSRADSASEHIGERLLELADWREREDDGRPDAEGGGTVYRTGPFELRTFDELHVELDRPSAAFGGPDAVDLLVFVSRHSGETGALLTAHFTGNFGPAKYGGAEGSFARAAPNAQKALVRAFDHYAPEEYDVGIETTHHGPTDAAVPSLFAELGSGEEQWTDADGARAVARGVLALADVPPDLVGDDGRRRQLVGLGGGHYAPRFTRVVRETAWAVGHVGADWQLNAMGDPDERRDVLERAFAESAAEFALVDGDRPELRATLESLGYGVVSETWVREVGDRPLALVESLEAELSTVDEGLRFGEVAAGDYVLRELPTDLAAAAAGVDREAALAAVAERAVAFESTEAGTVPAGRAALPSPDAYDDVVDALADVLRRKYDAVEREADRVVARERGFDPSKAATLGVSEGPAFGRLAAGEPVEVNGRTIDPEVVRSERREEFEI